MNNQSQPTTKTMTVDTYLSNSSRVIEYAESISSTDPDRSSEILISQLREHLKLLRAITEKNPQLKTAN